MAEAIWVLLRVAKAPGPGMDGEGKGTSGREGGHLLSSSQLIHPSCTRGRGSAGGHLGTEGASAGADAPGSVHVTPGVGPSRCARSGQD